MKFSIRPQNNIPQGKKQITTRQKGKPTKETNPRTKICQIAKKKKKKKKKKKRVHFCSLVNGASNQKTGTS